MRHFAAHTVRTVLLLLYLNALAGPCSKLQSRHSQFSRNVWRTVINRHLPEIHLSARYITTPCSRPVLSRFSSLDHVSVFPSYFGNAQRDRTPEPGTSQGTSPPVRSRSALKVQSVPPIFQGPARLRIAPSQPVSHSSVCLVYGCLIMFLNVAHIRLRH
ncbi:hypothetical protein DFH94DRAFT_770568 [Russula ochroleuca]|uniref:Secreted protein n=1 Tax=Russula ochroleuca TaxID=152965 RepID=A0A9P5MPE5_9AGAM|nr:hypothetical protein DFH94DRAFT_770568 [Russula ochroleuca]